MKVAVYSYTVIDIIDETTRYACMHVAAHAVVHFRYVASNVYIQDKPLGQCNFGCAWLIAIAT